MTRDKGWGELSLVLTDDAGMRCVNRRYLDNPDTTDVISFRYDPVPGAATFYSGEVIVNVQRALEAGPAHGGIPHELALYMAHGCDHLAGETDRTRAGYARMRRRELRWLGKANQLGMLNGLIRPPLTRMLHE